MGYICHFSNPIPNLKFLFGFFFVDFIKDTFCSFKRKQLNVSFQTLRTKFTNELFVPFSFLPGSKLFRRYNKFINFIFRANCPLAYEELPAREGITVRRNTSVNLFVSSTPFVNVEMFMFQICTQGLSSFLVLSKKYA